MAITKENFCHIEDTILGGKVLFYATPSNSSADPHYTLFQIAFTEAGVVTVTKSYSGEQASRLRDSWPDLMDFINRAREMAHIASRLEAIDAFELGA